MGQNQHYISKVVTKPWRTADHELHYFDFTSGQLTSEHEDHLFARFDLWSEQLEPVFRKSFEKRLENDVKAFMAQKGTPAKLEPEQFRSIILMHIFNVMRSMKAKHGIDTIDKFSRLSNKEMNAEIAEFAKPYDFLKIPLNPAYRMFYPDHGYFHIPLANGGTSDTEIGFGIPLSPSVAFGFVPKGYDISGLVDLALNSETFFVNLSVGVTGDKVVIHPDLVNEANLANKILKARETNARAAALIQRSSPNLAQRISTAVKNIQASVKVHDK